MKTIFCNQVIKKEIKNIHKNINDIFHELTMEETLVVGFNWNKEKICKIKESGELKELIKFFYKWDYDNGKRALSDFGLYDRMAIQNAKYRAIFMQRMKRMDIKLNEKFTIGELEKLSLYGQEYGTIAYAIKCYLIANFGENRDSYRGIQPQTGPVYNSVWNLFKIEESQYRQTLRCNKLAEQLGVSPIYINSALYSMGE